MLKKFMAVAALTLCFTSAHAKDDDSAPTSAVKGRPCYRVVTGLEGNPIAVNLSQVLFMDIEKLGKNNYTNIKELDDKTYVLTMHVSVHRHGRMPYLYFKDKASATKALHEMVAAAAKCR